MGRILLSMLLAVSCAGFAKAQQLAGEPAEKIKAELLKFKEEQDKAFDSTGTSHNYAEEWATRHEADGLVHLTDRLRGKTELVDELATTRRKIISSKHYGHQFHIYGTGENGTGAVVTYWADATVEIEGKRTSDHAFCVDTLVKSGGQWYVVVHSTHHIKEQQ